MDSSPSGNNVWGTNIEGEYTEPGSGASEYYLRSPNIDLSVYKGTKLTLSFYHYYTFEEDDYDGGIFEISKDDGILWEQRFPKHGYDSKINSSSNPLFNRDAFTGNSSGWVKEEIFLTEFDDQTQFSFRFHFATNGQDSDYGWYIDDVVITSTSISDGELELFSASISGGRGPINEIQFAPVLTIIDTTNPISSDGALTQWEVHTVTGGQGILKIFREENDKFVHVTEVSVSVEAGKNVIDLDPPIQVKAGDYVGWYGADVDIWASASGGGISYQLDGDIKETLPKSSWGTPIDNSFSIRATGLIRVDSGTFTSQVHYAGSEAIWGEIIWERDLPNSNVDIELQTRTGNDENPDHPSWDLWKTVSSNSQEIIINSPNARYIQFQAILKSNRDPYTPILKSVNITYSKYLPRGNIETRDFIPGEEGSIPDTVVQWLELTPTDFANGQGQTIEYHYSIDSGNTWYLVPFGGDLREVSVLEGKIRFRIELSTDDTTKSPEINDITLSYSTAQPRMRLRLEVDRKEGSPGDKIVFRIFYNNIDIGDAEDVNIQLILDANLTFNSAVFPDKFPEKTTKSSIGNTIQWEFDTVEPTESGEKFFTVTTKIKNIDKESAFFVRAKLNYTDVGGNDYPEVSSNSVEVRVYPALDILFVLLVGIIMAVIIILIIIIVTKKVLKEEVEETIALSDIGSGIGYLVMEDNPRKSYGVFSDFIDSGKQGLCITRTFPGRVMANYTFDDVSLLWLSRSRDQNSILPTNLGAVMRSVKDFMAENDDTVVLLDGLEYLIVHNDFPKVLKLVHGMNELVAINDARLIIPLNPLTLDEDKVALLKRDLKLIDKK
jgi:hypothetical protein